MLRAMNRRLLPIVLLALFALTFTATTRADDLKAMEGTWKVASAEAGGKAVESDDLSALVVTIAGDHYTAKLKEGLEAGTVKLDETQKLKTMDATKTEGFEAGKVIKAVYELKDDTMRVCYAMDGGERPTELATKDGSQWLLITYQREK